MPSPRGANKMVEFQKGGDSRCSADNSDGESDYPNCKNLTIEEKNYKKYLRYLKVYS